MRKAFSTLELLMVIAILLVLLLFAMEVLHELMKVIQKWR
jgi:prepilin-type N-terminal cleavage/methylation domain-containing protein